MNYLEFEEPIKTLREQLVQAKDIESKNDLDMTTTIVELEEKIVEVTQEIYGKLNAWQRVLVSRHPDRPYALDYMNAITDGEFMELHGDRNVNLALGTLLRRAVADETWDNFVYPALGNSRCKDPCVYLICLDLKKS